MEEAIVTSGKKIVRDFYNPVKRTHHSHYTESVIHGHVSTVNEDNSPYSWNEGNGNVDGVASITKPNIYESGTPYNEGEVTAIPKEEETINYEDSDSLVGGLFRGRDFITSESWVSNEIVKSRIVSSDSNFVYLDCIVDIETMSFEHRQLPKHLFSNFKSLKTGSLAIINLKSKPNSFRVDVHQGEGLINPELFDINDEIQELKGRDLGTKLREW